MKEIRLTREELFEMVWREPLTVIAKRYHIVYAELRKIYLKLDIPVPDGGHWSKLQWGKPVTIPILPSDTSVKQDIVLIEREPGDPDIINDIHDKEGVCNTEPLFKVPTRLANPDALVTKAKEFFEAHKGGFWGSNIRFLEGEDVLSIDVQYSNLGRALRIFDTVIKILRSRGHSISFGWKGTEAVIYGQEIGMRIREIHKVADKPKDRYSSRELEPTGRFTFLIGRHYDKAVSDGRKPIEEKIDSIISKLEAEAKQWHDWRLEGEIRAKERKEQLRIEQEARARKEKELSDFKSLYILANRLHQANIMRNYLSQKGDNAKDGGENTSEFGQWLVWAQQKIDWYDPLINRVDDTFTEDDKSNIFKDLIQRPTSSH